MDLEGLEAEGDRREKNMKGLFSGMLHDREANNTRRSQNNIERSKTKAHGAFTYHHITSHHHIITSSQRRSSLLSALSTPPVEIWNPERTGEMQGKFVSRRRKQTERENRERERARARKEEYQGSYQALLILLDFLALPCLAPCRALPTAVVETLKNFNLWTYISRAGG